MGAVFRFDGELVKLVAHHNCTPEVLEVLNRTHPGPPQPDQASGRAILTRAVAQVEDTLADPTYHQEIAHAGNWRSVLAVPMLRAGAPIGAIVMDWSPSPLLVMTTTVTGLLLLAGLSPAGMAASLAARSISACPGGGHVRFDQQRTWAEL
jgi:hypothetical protein